MSFDNNFHLKLETQLYPFILNYKSNYNYKFLIINSNLTNYWAMIFQSDVYLFYSNQIMSFYKICYFEKLGNLSIWLPNVLKKTVKNIFSSF